MCGIFGIISQDPIEKTIFHAKNAVASLSHRGPDGEGIYFDKHHGVVLCHHRLAIIDPEHGAQPMTTDDGKLTIVFNGAIYNYLELRRTLIAKGHSIHSFCDTEVILYAYREWGERCVDHFLGMFAFAIWDKEKKRLFCARDRVGIKPFYYYFNHEKLLFASEIKAILASHIKPIANERGLQDYLTFQFCLGHKTLFKDIYKLEPGHFMILSLEDRDLKPHIVQYWNVQYEEDKTQDETHDETWFTDHLSMLIEDSIRLHLRSDVPLGAHLSGGLDSSSIVCLTAGLLPNERLKTFTGAFNEGPQYDETPYAKFIAESINAEYHDVYISGKEFPHILPKLLYYMDEPVAGPGLIPQYYISKLAAQSVKVILGGQGGDELFIGYARYLMLYLEQCLFNAIHERKNPHCSLMDLVHGLPMLQSYQPTLQKLWREGLFESADKRYFNLISRQEKNARLYSPDLLLSGYSPFVAFQEIFHYPGQSSLMNQMTYFDLKSSLPALLQVEDRMSMMVALESRVPFLDHRIIEWMARIPTQIKFSGGRMKHLFKAAVKNTVPKPILERKDKMGFPTPLTLWAKGIAKEFVMDTLTSTRAKQRGIYNTYEIDTLLNKETEFGRELWGLLCLELWYQIYIDGEYVKEFSNKTVLKSRLVAA